MALVTVTWPDGVTTSMSSHKLHRELPEGVKLSGPDLATGEQDQSEDLAHFDDRGEGAVEGIDEDEDEEDLSAGRGAGSNRGGELAQAWNEGWRCRWTQVNPKSSGSMSAANYERYKHAQTLLEARQLGCRFQDLKWDVAHGFVSLYIPGPGLSADSRIWTPSAVSHAKAKSAADSAKPLAASASS